MFTLPEWHFSFLCHSKSCPSIANWGKDKLTRSFGQCCCFKFSVFRKNNSLQYWIKSKLSFLTGTYFPFFPYDHFLLVKNKKRQKLFKVKYGSEKYLLKKKNNIYKISQPDASNPKIFASNILLVVPKIPSTSIINIGPSLYLCRYRKNICYF